jgi:type II restriction/modification system DNA methylase subunit YeeA
MAKGGAFGADDVPWFNGGLFADDSTLPLSVADLEILARAAKLDWSSVEPAIFGTLFERSLDPGKRAQTGAHYTAKEDILLIVEPVLMAPLRRRWQEVKAKAEAIIAKGEKELTARRAKRTAEGFSRKRYQATLRKVILDFVDELSHVRVLDPACGSGNFLYVSLKLLLDLWKEVSSFATANHLGGLLPYQVNPAQLYGIELNVYAHELASVVVWIGYIQWLHDNGFGVPPSPILQRLDNIKRMDAILAYDSTGKPVEPEWPQANVIIGNPPFLGGNRIRQELGDKYVNDLFVRYQDRVPAFADLVCYWFEKAREQLVVGKCKRAGLLATQGIRGGTNRKVLERIKEIGDIFWAQSDRDWILDGATVHVSMIAFDSGEEAMRELDGSKVEAINADLTAGVDLTAVAVLRENSNVCFMGPSPKGPFDLAESVAVQMLAAPPNVSGRNNSDVVRPVASAVDLVQRNRRKWTIDFALMASEEAAQYEAPFEHVKVHVFPVRSRNRRAAYAKRWWQYAEARPGMRRALAGKHRFIATPEVSKHRVFVWLDCRVLSNQQTLVFARDDDYFFGILQSGVHELWARRKGTQLREVQSGFRYTPTTTFETFPFPWPPGKEPKHDPKIEAIAAAARDLVRKRDAWLNPVGASDAELKKLTLTALYNQRPQWLQDAHRTLDEAVLNAYGWPADISNDELLQRLLALNHARAAAKGPAP